MKKKLSVLFGLTLAFGACLLAASCSGDPYQKYFDAGYKVMVTYDDNGGAFFNNKGDTLLVDMIDPGRYTADADGKTRIKLVSPTDPVRPSGGADSISVVRDGHSLVGWYRTRTAVTDESGNLLDDDGNVLTADSDGNYYFTDAEGKEVPSYPSYEYDGLWNFDTDAIEYSGEEKLEVTLYAGWVPYYEFDYYYLDGGEWKKLDSVTKFNYVDVKSEGSTKFDYDRLYIPVWENGAMNYSHRYGDRGLRDFEGIKGKTFNSAYTDPEMTSEITEYVEHTGTLDVEHCTAVGNVMNIYVVYDEGERYRIENAEQFSANPNRKGIFEILGDLDFTGVDWPAEYTANTFEGKIYGAGGADVKFSNVSAAFGNRNSVYGGLFGRISDAAEITGVTFENVTFTINAVTSLADASYGTISGEISDGAKLEDVSVAGTVTMRISGYIFFGDDYSVDMLAGGADEAIDSSAAQYKLYVFGDEMLGYFLYNVDVDGITVDGTSVKIAFLSEETESQESEYEIQVNNGGNL